MCPGRAFSVRRFPTLLSHLAEHRGGRNEAGDHCDAVVVEGRHSSVREDRALQEVGVPGSRELQLQDLPARLLHVGLPPDGVLGRFTQHCDTDKGL